MIGECTIRLTIANLVFAKSAIKNIANFSISLILLGLSIQGWGYHYYYISLIGV